MAIQGNSYERELKNLLSGEEKAIVKVVKTCDEREKSAYENLRINPFMVVRAAGSMGADLVALRENHSFLIEVKSSCDSIIHFSRNLHLMEQANKMKEECFKARVLLIYAFRLKNQRGDPWRIFYLPIDEDLKGTMGLLQRRLPKIKHSVNGNYLMKWSDGMKLSEFIEYMLL
ncbi:MAG: Holliday junction resolvase [archaeon]|nr:Holliday junction resolvase [archaeon]